MPITATCVIVVFTTLFGLFGGGGGQEKDRAEQLVGGVFFSVPGEIVEAGGTSTLREAEAHGMRGSR